MKTLQRNPAAAAVGPSVPRFAPPRPPLKRTTARFPWVAERIERAWESPEKFQRVIDELLIDTRGDRQGFPFEVVDELADLKVYYETWLHPKRGRGL